MSTVAAVPCVRARSIREAVEALAAHPRWLILAGGTDVMVARERVSSATGVLDLFGVDELHQVVEDARGVRIGACATFAELLARPVLRQRLPLLWEAARSVGAVQIRERATLGGNVMTASPIGDLLPPLLALDARMVLSSVAGDRTVEYGQFIAGYRSVHIGPGELLTAIDVRFPPPGAVQHWRKVGTRAAQAISKVSLAAMATVIDGRAERVRLAFGGLADRPIRVHRVERLIEGAVPDESLARRVRLTVRGAVDPIDDVRSTAAYRREIAGNITARFVQMLTAAS